MLAQHRAALAAYVSPGNLKTFRYRPVVRDGYGNAVWIGIRTYPTPELAIGVAHAVMEATRYEPSEILV